MKRFEILAAVAAAALVPAVADAQTAPAAGTQATASATGTNKAAVPLTSLGKGAQGPVLAMTKAQLDAAASAQQQQASAAFRSQLVAGASVYGSGGTKLGTIKAVDASSVTLTTDQGDAKLPIAGFGPGPQGVTIGMTAAQLSAAMGAAAPAAGATTATDATATTPATTSETSTTTTSNKKTKPRK
jgi:hypothetical protein